MKTERRDFLGLTGRVETGELPISEAIGFAEAALGGGRATIHDVDDLLRSALADLDARFYKRAFIGASICAAAMEGAPRRGVRAFLLRLAGAKDGGVLAGRAHLVRASAALEVGALDAARDSANAALEDLADSPSQAIALIYRSRANTNLGDAAAGSLDAQHALRLLEALPRDTPSIDNYTLDASIVLADALSRLGSRADALAVLDNAANNPSAERRSAQLTYWRTTIASRGDH